MRPRVSAARSAAASLSSAARETTMRRPSSESSVTRHSMFWFTKASGFSILPSAICDSGQKARRPLMFTSKPPLLRPVSLPSTGRRRLPFGELAALPDLGAGLDDRGFDLVADVQALELRCVHDGLGRATVGNVGIFARDRDDRAAEQLTLLRGFEVQILHRLGKRR